MKIIIVGAGVIGINLARTLSEENHEVYLIERDEATARKVDEKLDVKVVVGNGADPDTLKEAGAESADMVIAVTLSDETNLVVCSLASAFGTKQMIARVRNASLNLALGVFGYDKFHINETINPEEVAAYSILKAVETPGAREVADFSSGRILLRAFDIPLNSPLCGQKIGELREEAFPWPFLIVAIIRNSEVLIPKGNTIIEPSERIYVLLPSTSVSEFLTFVDPAIRKPKKVIIYGASKIGEKVAQEISAYIKDVVLLEEDIQWAEEVAGRLEAVRVINGAGSEADILKEAGIEAADAFIAVSENDHSNLVSAVLAKKMGAKTTIITTQQPDYATIVRALDIDVIINPRFLAVDQILRLVRGKGISAITKFMERDAEALELVAEKDSPITQGPIKKINIPKNAIIGAICRDSEVFLANGESCIQEGETVIVFCQENAAKKIQALFTAKKIF